MKLIICMMLAAPITVTANTAADMWVGFIGSFFEPGACDSVPDNRGVLTCWDKTGSYDSAGQAGYTYSYKENRRSYVCDTYPFDTSVVGRRKVVDAMCAIKLGG